jgi:hypothetical protein
MIQALAYSALAVAAEDYFLVRRVMKAYDVVSDAKDVLKLLSYTEDLPKDLVNPIAYDEIYFYLITIGLYNEGHRNTPFSNWTLVMDIADAALSSDIFANAPKDPLNKVAAYAIALGRSISSLDPDFINELAALCIEETNYQQLLHAASKATNSKAAIDTMNAKLLSLGVPSKYIRNVVGMFSEGVISTYLTEQRESMTTASLSLMDSFTRTVYSVVLSNLAPVTEINVSGSKTGSLKIYTSSLPLMRNDLRYEQPRSTRYQSSTLTSSMVAATEKRIMISLGYAYDSSTREWVQSHDAYLKEKSQNLETVIADSVKSEVVTRSVDKISDLLRKAMRKSNSRLAKRKL